MSSLLKEAERNIINQAKLLQETLDYLDALRNASYKILMLTSITRISTMLCS